MFYCSTPGRVDVTPVLKRVAVPGVYDLLDLYESMDVLQSGRTGGLTGKPTSHYQSPVRPVELRTCSHYQHIVIDPQAAVQAQLQLHHRLELARLKLV